jgi:hypothetical protein
MSTISGISFALPVLPEHSILNVANSHAVLNHLLAERPCPSYPPLRLSQILQLIKNGSADVVTLIEWLGVFNDDFDFMDSSQQDEACILLWQAIAENPRVARLALHIAANCLCGFQRKFPICLIESMGIAKDHLKGKNKTRLLWLLALKNQNFAQCVRLAISNGVSPLSFNETLNMPKLGRFREGVVHAAALFIDSVFEPKNTRVIEHCIEEMTGSEKVYFYDLILEHNESAIGFVEEKIRFHCLPDSKNSLWYNLNYLSRDKLRERFNLGGYFLLKGIVDKICQPGRLDSSEFAEKDIKQLKSRSAFWSNYSESFNQVRLLMPTRTAKSIGHSARLKTTDIIILPDIVDEVVEVFIFEMGTNIVVEVLRGVASEIRLFALTPRNQSRLLKDNQLTLRKIREMACICIFDHVKLWQYFCEKTLRTDFGILPNKKITVFSGMGREYVNYSKANGLPSPTSALVKDRLDQLETWNKVFWTREANIKNLQPNTVTGNGWKEMQFAKLAQSQDNSNEFLGLVTKAADLGNSEAMCLKAVSIFKSKTATFNQWKEAEELVNKAINEGYEPANKISLMYKKEKTNGGARLNQSDLARINKRVKNKQTLPEIISKKINKNSERPYIRLKIDELETLSNFINDTKMKKGMIDELSRRPVKPRNNALIAKLRK